MGLLAIADYPHTQRVIVPMLMDAASRLGIKSVRIPKADESVFDADVMIIAGDCRRFDDYWRMLRKARRRPFTILWQFEPLPAPEMAGLLEPLVASVGRTRHITDHGRLGIAAQRILLFPNPVINAVRRMRVNRLKSRIHATTSLDVGPLTTDELYRPAAIYNHIRRRHEEGLIDAIVVSVESRREFFDSVGIPSTFVPIGWHPMWGQDLGRPRDLDVLFLGTVDEYRRPLLEKLRHVLEEAGFSFRVIEDGCRGTERDELLSRTKISLDLPRLPWELPGMRFLMSMGCGAMVVCAWEGRTSPPYEAGRHLVCSSAEDLPSTVMHYLRNEDQRLAITANAHRMLTREHTLERSLARLMDIAAGNPVRTEVTV